MPLSDLIDHPYILFLAFDCETVNDAPQASEKQGVKRVILSTEQVIRRVASGKIVNNPTISGILAHLLLEGRRLHIVNGKLRLV